VESNVKGCEQKKQNRARWYCKEKVQEGSGGVGRLSGKKGLGVYHLEVVKQKVLLKETLIRVKGRD